MNTGKNHHSQEIERRAELHRRPGHVLEPVDAAHQHEHDRHDVPMSALLARTRGDKAPRLEAFPSAPPRVRTEQMRLEDPERAERD